jgi:hypothetical protein
MVAGALPFIIMAASRAMLVLVAAAVRAIVLARLFPVLGLAIMTGFSPWHLISAASVTTPSSLAIVVAYDNSFLRDL